LSQQLAVQQEAVERKERAVEEAESTLREQEEKASGEEKRLGQLVRTTGFLQIFFFFFFFFFLFNFFVTRPYFRLCCFRSMALKTRGRSLVNPR
jgi:hypothetical protein